MIQHSATGTVYIGRTNNLKRRLSEHNNNETRSTSRKEGEWIIVYAEAYRNEEDAVERELKLKQRGSAKQRLRKRIKRSLLEIKR